MSPEQATGDQSVGPATDIYALGCVLYEMLAGEPPFTGSTPQAVLGKIITGDVPSARAERISVPAHVDAAIAKALEKLPADRFPNAGVLAGALSDPFFRHGAAVGGTRPVAGVRHVPFWREALPWGLIPLSLLAATLLRSDQRAPGVPEVFDHQLPAEAPLTFTGGSFDGVGWPAFSMSPQEDYFVYVTERGEGTELWYYDRSTGSGRAIEGTAGAYSPAVSPDGEWVAFLAEGQLKRVPVEGGSAVPVMDARGVYGGAHWFSSDGILAYARGGRIRIVDPSTRVVEERGENVTCHLPHVLENGHVLCNLTSYEVRGLYRDSLSLSTLNRTVFGTNPRVVGNEYVTFVTPEGDLQIASLDRETLAFGRPVTVRRGLRREGDSGAAHYAVTPSGALVYAAGDNAEVGRLVRRSHGEDATAPLSVDPAPFTSFRVSPDADRLAAVVVSLNGRELSVYDLRTGARSDPWLTSKWMRDPVWSPSGSRLAVATVSATEARTVAFGDPSGGPPRDALEVDGDPLHFVSEDLLLTSAGVLIDFGRDPPAVDTGSGPGLALGTLSPDGSRIAFGVARGGGFDVLVESYPEREHRHVVSPEGGQDPVWLASSRLTYRLGRSWFTVDVPPQPEETPAEPMFWFRDDRFVDTPGRSVVPGAGESVIYKQATTGATTTSLRVVPNWLEGAMRAADEANSR
jgi:serine/threonine-protein kinase